MEILAFGGSGAETGNAAALEPSEAENSTAWLARRAISSIVISLPTSDGAPDSSFRMLLCSRPRALVIFWEKNALPDRNEAAWTALSRPFHCLALRYHF